MLESKFISFIQIFSAIWIDAVLIAILLSEELGGSFEDDAYNS